MAVIMLEKGYGQNESEEQLDWRNVPQHTQSLIIINTTVFLKKAPGPT